MRKFIKEAFIPLFINYLNENPIAQTIDESEAKSDDENHLNNEKNYLMIFSTEWKLFGKKPKLEI